MQGKLTEGVQANHVRDEKQPGRESLTLILLHGGSWMAQLDTHRPPVALVSSTALDPESQTVRRLLSWMVFGVELAREESRNST